MPVAEKFLHKQYLNKEDTNRHANMEWGNLTDPQY